MIMKHYLLGVSFTILGLFFCLVRWVSLYSFYKNSQMSSQLPFMGGILICIGIHLITPLKSFWWLGFLFDSSLSWEWLILFCKKFLNK